MASATSVIYNSLSFIHKCSLSNSILPGLTQVRHYAARKSTREKARKKKTMIAVKKLTLADKIQRSKKIKTTNIIKPDYLKYFDESKPASIDDVYLGRMFRWNIYPFAEAISNHREFFHPSLYDYENPHVQIQIEFNMKGIKKQKPVETFQKLIKVKYTFDHGEERKILAICPPDEEMKLEAAGALTAGGISIIKEIMNGGIVLDNYDTVIANAKLMPELLPIRGLLKKKTPSLKTGTLGIDTMQLLNHHLYGIRCTVMPYKDFPEFGYSTVSIGTLDMDVQHLEENLQTILNAIMLSKPKRSDSFITRIRVLCPPSIEKFKIDCNLYIKEKEENPQEQKNKVTVSLK